MRNVIGKAISQYCHQNRISLNELARQSDTDSEQLNLLMTGRRQGISYQTWRKLEPFLRDIIDAE